MNEMISIIVPVYNVERYLRECIESIIAQTYSNLEIILVDDGSTDNSGNLCDEFALKDKRIRIIHKQNEGLSSARNAGLNIAKGKYVGFVDSDDVISNEMYEILYKRIVEDKTDLSICNCNRINSFGCLVDSINEPMIREGENIISGKKALENIFEGEFSWRWVTAWNKLYKKSMFDGVKYPVGKIHEDEFIIHQIFLKCNKLSVINKVLYYYRQNDSGIMANRNYKAFLNQAEALLTRGIECIDLMGSGWHHCNCSTIRINFFSVDYNDITVVDDQKVIKELRDIYLKYIRLLKNRNYISGVKFLYLLFQFYSPKRVSEIIQIITKVSNIIKKEINWIQFKKNEYIKKINKSDLLLIDTPTHGNLGDHAIVLAQNELLRDIFPDKKILEITADELDKYLKKLQKLISTDKYIFIPGGGFLGCLWPNEEARFQKILSILKNNNIIVFPQTITFDMNSKEGITYFQKSYSLYKNHPNLTFFVREKRSFRFTKENMPELTSLLVPDIVLSYRYEGRRINRKGILFCMRKDIEKSISDTDIDHVIKSLRKLYPSENMVVTDTVLRKKIMPMQRKQEVLKKLRQFEEVKLVITDRLHGMIFAAITGTPCIAFSNSNGKVKAVYEWINQLEYIKYLDSVVDFENNLRSLDLNKTYKYDYDLMNEFFEPLYAYLKNIKTNE